MLNAITYVAIVSVKYEDMVKVENYYNYNGVSQRRFHMTDHTQFIIAMFIFNIVID